MSERLRVYTTDGNVHSFYYRSDTYVHDGVLVVSDTGQMPAKVTRFSLANVTHWGVEEQP